MDSKPFRTRRYEWSSVCQKINEPISSDRPLNTCVNMSTETVLSLDCSVPDTDIFTWFLCHSWLLMKEASYVVMVPIEGMTISFNKVKNAFVDVTRGKLTYISPNSSPDSLEVSSFYFIKNWKYVNVHDGCDSPQIRWPLISSFWSCDWVRMYIKQHTKSLKDDMHRNVFTVTLSEIIASWN